MPVDSPTSPVDPAGPVRIPPDSPGGLDEEPSLPRRPVRRLVLGVIVVGMLAMWGYVLYLAFGPGRQPPIDRLEDPAFAAAAEERCATAVDQVESLPFANETATSAERADVLDQANDRFGAMLHDLDGMTEQVPPGDQRRRVTEWLEDWRLLVQDRQDYAAALRIDPGARLLISEKDDTGRHITGWIDEFANANQMPSCATPTDV